MVYFSKLNNLLKTTYKLVINIFPFLVFLTYGLVFTETYTYIGSLKKYLLVDSRLILYVTVFLAIFIAIMATKKQITNQFLVTTFIINNLLSPLVIFFYYYLLMAEAIHYPNFVFSTYHIQPDNMVNIVYLNLSLLGCYWLSKNYSIRRIIQKLNSIEVDINKNKKLNNQSNKIKTIIQKTTHFEVILIIILTVLLSNYLLVNITSTFAKISTDLVFIVNNPNLNYDQKMEKAWGKMYYYFIFLNKNVPVEAIIATPPAQHRWLRTGNTVVMRYFLFPHRLVNVKETWNVDTLSQLPTEEYDYMMLVPGDWDDNSVPEGWPKRYIKAEYVEYFNKNTMTGEKVMGDFDPLLLKNQTSWGIIKIKK